MNLLQQIDSYLTALIIITVILIGVLAALYYYLFKVKKITAKEERINYDYFKRRDSSAYLRFDNIISEKGNDMSSAGIIDCGNNVFVAGLNIVGYNFAVASPEEKMRTITNAIALANVIKQPVQFRQSVKSIELTDNIEVYKESQRKLEVEAWKVSEDLKAARDTLADNVDDYEISNELMTQIDALSLRYQSLTWQIDECRTLIKFMEDMSSRKSEAQKVNQFMFSYRFNPGDYTETLTKEEIYVKAMEELKTMSLSYIDAIENCGCRATRLSAEDMVSLLYHHSCPISADDVKMEELFNSTYQNLFVQSNSLYELEKKRRGEEEVIRRMRELERVRSEMIRNQYVERERNDRDVKRELVEIYGAEGEE